MAILKVLEYPDPRLRMHARQVSEFGDGLQALIDDMFETLYAGNAIGLSAPQVDDLRAVLVMDLSGNASEPRVYVNPEILKSSVPGLVEESCMSVPDVVGNVVRATQIQVRAQDRTGEVFCRDLDGMHAVCLQHEMDHLVGKLFIDRLPFFRRLRIKAAAKARKKKEGASGNRPAAA